MNTHFKYALDQIKANEALVQKTEEYLRSSILKELNAGKNEKNEKWRLIEMKKIAMVAGLLILLIGGGAKIYATPSSYVSIDINPSVELGVNTFGQVVEAEGYNTDGKKVLNGIKVTGMNVTKAVSTIIDSATEKGFIANDGSTTISITAANDNDNNGAKLNAEAETGVKEALLKNDKSADLLKDNVALARRDEARKLGITPGKLNLIEKLQAVDSSATVDQYKDAKVKEIMKVISSKKDKGNALGNKSDNAGVGNKNDNAGEGNKNDNAGLSNHSGGNTGGQAQGNSGGNRR